MNKILVVYKKSAYELYSNSRDKDAREFVNADTPDAQRIRRSHDMQHQTIDKIVSILAKHNLSYDLIYRAELRNFNELGIAEADDSYRTDGRELVVSIGGDGTFLEVSHYVKDTQLLGVNSDPENSTGFFCCSNADNFEYFLNNICNIKIDKASSTEKVKRTSLARMELNLDGRILPELALNDILVAHENPAANTLCEVKVYDDNKDVIRHKGSGILICTAAGSSAWMYNENGMLLDLSASHFQYIQRGVRGAQSNFAEDLTITSLTRKLCIFVDGLHLMYDFPIGKELYISKGQPLNVVGDLHEKRKLFR